MLAILTYHSVNILGNDYADNDHVALREDLQLITELGLRIRPLGDALAAASPDAPPGVVLTFDDGASFDFEDFEHPTCGFQKSFHRIMREFRTAHPQAQPELHASAFVIVSPDAREQIDRIDFGGRGWWHDRWWRPAAEDGLLAIENHSWDHNHPSLPETAVTEQRSDDFWCVDTRAKADAEIRQAAGYLRSRGITSRFFAYPWGHANDYLKTEYLPRHGPELGIDAALGTQPELAGPGSDRWDLPRFVCGSDWKSPEELAAILREL